MKVNKRSYDKDFLKVIGIYKNKKFLNIYIMEKLLYSIYDFTTKKIKDVNIKKLTELSNDSKNLSNIYCLRNELKKINILNYYHNKIVHNLIKQISIFFEKKNVNMSFNFNYLGNIVNKIVIY